MHGGDDHRLVDAGGAGVESATEDVGKTEHVVDLVGEIAAAGGHDHVAAGFQRQFGMNLRVRVGQGKDDRTVGHGRQHLGAEDVGAGHADEHVRALDGIGQAALFGDLGIGQLVGVEVVAFAVDHALAVDQQDVAQISAEFHQQIHRGNPRRTGADADDARFLETLALQFQGVEQTGGDDDGGAVLVVVENRDVEPFAQAFLDLETARRRNILEIDAAEAAGDVGHGLDEGIGVGGGYLDVEDVDVGKGLEQHGLAFHHRLAGQCADIAQAQHRGTVGDHRDQVALGRVAIGGIGVGRDLAHRLGHARRVGQGQILLGGGGLGDLDGDLSGLRELVVIKGLFLHRNLVTG